MYNLFYFWLNVFLTLECMEGTVRCVMKWNFGTVAGAGAKSLDAGSGTAQNVATVPTLQHNSNGTVT